MSRRSTKQRRAARRRREAYRPHEQRRKFRRQVEVLRVASCALIDLWAALSCRSEARR